MIICLNSILDYWNMREIQWFLRYQLDNCNLLTFFVIEFFFQIIFCFLAAEMTLFSVLSSL